MMATLITPNLPEAEVIVGYTIDTIELMKKAARDLHKIGCTYVLVKGGHLSNDATDVLFDGEYFHLLEANDSSALTRMEQGVHFPLPLLRTLRKVYM